MNIILNNAKNTLILVLVASGLFSCQKKDAEPVKKEQEVVFTALEVAPGGGLKSTEEWECKDLSPDYAKILIGDDTYYSDVYRLGGKLYSNAIKLPVADGGGSKTYTINGFFLMHDNGTKGVFEDDEIVMATPTSTSLYKDYVSDPVALNFEVFDFQKAEIPIDVLCFQNNLFEGFGFDWFQVTQIIVRQHCFFGDICLNGVSPEPNVLDDYAGSWYDAEQLPPGVQVDMPAIFKIHSFRTYNGITDELPDSPLSNATTEYGYGAGFALCVEYPDQITLNGEIFTFDLWVLVRNSTGGFSYQLYDTYTCTDDGPLTKDDPPVLATGSNGVADFAIGNCSPMSTNIYSWLARP